LALIHDRKNGAHRALAQCGVDVARLRAAAMQLALGRIGPRRNQAQDHETEKRPPAARATQIVSRAIGVKMPILPRPLTPTVVAPLSLATPATVVSPPVAANSGHGPPAAQKPSWAAPLAPSRAAA